MRRPKARIAPRGTTEKVDTMPAGAAGMGGLVPVVVLWLPMVMTVTIAGVFGRADRRG